MDMNSVHLSNVLQLNITRLNEGMNVADIIVVLLEIAKERKLSASFLTTYHPFDKDKPYLKYGEKEPEQILIDKQAITDTIEILNHTITKNENDLVDLKRQRNKLGKILRGWT
jgi:hypothetical protein